MGEDGEDEEDGEGIPNPNGTATTSSAVGLDAGATSSTSLASDIVERNSALGGAAKRCCTHVRKLGQL